MPLGRIRLATDPETTPVFGEIGALRKLSARANGLTAQADLRPWFAGQ